MPSDTSPRRRQSNPGYNPGVHVSFPRRRGYTTTGVRRRTYGYDGHSSYSNPHSPAAGSYGYTSQSAAYHNYGGRPPTVTPYGYSGAYGYQGHTGTKIAMALAGGVVAGAGVSYLYHHWGTGRVDYNHMSCFSGWWSGSCSDCTTRFAASACYTEVSPSFDAARDDIMATGFIPADYTFPVMVNFTEVVGEDYLASRICPPPGWIASPESTTTVAPLLPTLPPALSVLSVPQLGAASSWQPPENQSLFLALTVVSELSSNGQSSGGSVPSQHDAKGSPQSGHMAFLTTAVLLLGGCCCFLVPLAVCMANRGGGRKKPRHRTDHGWSSSDDSSTESDSSMPGYMVAPQQRLQNYAGISGGCGGGFLNTAAPNGVTWRDYCRSYEVSVDSSGHIVGPWGECLAWAKVYELRNPGWERDLEYRDEGPCGQVIRAMLQASPDHTHQQIEEAAERLEEDCAESAECGRPLPVIGQYA